MTREDFYDLKRLVHWDWMLKRRARWEEQKAASCDGKHRFPTWDRAHAAIHRHTDASVRPYRCRNCGWYHLGEDRFSRRAA